MKSFTLVFLVLLFLSPTLFGQQSQIDNVENTITLKVSQLKSTAPDNVVDINNIGLGRALDIDQINSNSLESAAVIRNAGKSNGLFVKNTRTANTSPAILGIGLGTAPGVQGVNETNGPAVKGIKKLNETNHAGLFENTNANNADATLKSETNGKGQAGLFINTNALNAKATVEAQTNSNTDAAIQGVNSATGVSIFGSKSGAATNQAGLFNNTNAANGTAALEANSNSGGFAILGNNSAAGSSVAGTKSAAATGHAGLFLNTNAANPDATLYGQSNSGGAAIEGLNTAAGTSVRGVKPVMAMGIAGEFANLNAANLAPALLANSLGDSPAFEALQTGAGPSIIAVKMGTATGSSAYFENANLLNSGPVLHVKDINTDDFGMAVLVDGNARVNHNLFTQHFNVVNTAFDRPAAAIKNFNSDAPSLLIDHSADSLSSIASTVKIDQHALGNGIEIILDNALNDADGITATTAGKGSAGSFITSNTSNTSPAIFAESAGLGPTVSAENSGIGHTVSATKSTSLGHAGFFHTSSAANLEATVKIIHADPTVNALDVDGNVKFSGDLVADDIIANTLTAGAKAFRINHPLDPENKYLKHISIETDEMMNLYTGNIVLDKKGKAVVELPIWFEALNCDFRYHLTCVGKHGRVYISKEIKNGKFEIAGGKKGMKVSWQVTGTRHDEFAKNNPLEVEQWKK